jgi:hypothetical protein
VEDLWWKLTVDWPCALHRWCWAYLAMPLLAQLERMTFKRVIYLAALTLVIIALVQVVTVDVAFMWAGDTVFYFEVASAVMFFAFRVHARQMVRVIGHKMRATARRLTAGLKRYSRTVRQWRNANAMRRRNGASHPKRSDDEPTGWTGGLHAHA